jgi:4-hydroxy-3-methylbut-2-enyl diphosphate reductase
VGVGYTLGMSILEIHLAHTQGFCAGVDSAIEVVNLAIDKYGTPLYVRHEIVHNTSVIKEFESRGVRFIESLADVPDDHVVVLSAHGTAPDVFLEAKARGLKLIDATCPLVTKVHRQAVKFSERGIQTVLIGHRGHQELLGTSGYVDPTLLFVVEDEADVDALVVNPELPIGYLTQTTLSVEDTRGMIEKLHQRFPDIQGPPKANICYATQNRQDAVRELTEVCDLVIICGSPSSSNSNRLRETAENCGVESYIIDTVEELQLDWLRDKKKVGISSGASVPRYVVDAVVAKIKSIFLDAVVFEKPTIEVGIQFPIPTI